MLSADLHCHVCQGRAAQIPNAALCWPPYFGIRLTDHGGTAYGIQGTSDEVRQKQDECKSLLQAMPGS